MSVRPETLFYRVIEELALKERLRARGAPKFHWAFPLGAFLGQLRPAKKAPSTADRPMADRRSQPPKKNTQCEFPKFGARPTLRRFLNAWFRFLKQRPGPQPD